MFETAPDPALVFKREGATSLAVVTGFLAWAW
jgi:hypothetical protein